MLSSPSPYREIDRDHHLHPFTNHFRLGEKGVRVIREAKGVYVWDVDGNKLLDGMSGLWCVNIGYGRDELAQAAYRQMKKLPYYNNFFQCSNEPAVLLSERLAKLAPGFSHVFYTNSGSEANDTVVRLVRHYWSMEGKPDKDIIISRRNGYHGSTMAGASLGGMQPMHAQGGLPIEGIAHVMQPYAFGEGRGEDPEEFGLRAARDLENKIEELGSDRVAAFIGEPVQGAGGVVIPPESYWPEVQRICKEHDVLLVADEVICGFGRLGRWFGSQHYGINADLMPIAKALTSGYAPMGGVLVGGRVAEAFTGKDFEFAHGFTSSGHPVCAAVAIENLRIMEQEGIIDYAREKAAPRFGEALASLAEHPLVGEVRSREMLGAIELVKEKGQLAPFDDVGAAGAICRDLAVQNGVVMRAVRDTMVLAPPLVISDAEIDELAAKVGAVLDQAHEALARAGTVH